MSTTHDSRQSDSTPYEDHYLGAPDVCSNCLSLIRVERIDAYRSNDLKAEGTLTRKRDTTTVDYHDSDPIPPQSQGTFCACGVESARDRIWSGEDIDRTRFEDLLTNLIRTAEAKDIDLKRKETVAYALQKFKDGAGTDDALATALDAGIVAQINAD